ncbi:MAG TPA: SBBP repeat-containing protein, partial [Nitrospiria bacterium]|nr:SBBP repeat-containing protein [Nitrospiria bacterium]
MPKWTQGILTKDKAMKLNHIRRNRGLTMTALAGVLALVWASIAGAATAGGTQAVRQAADQASVHGAYGQLPLSFIHNNGQVDAKVRFYEKGSGHATYFTTDGVYLSLTKGRSSSADSSLITLRPQGANPNVQIVADHEQAGKVNYLVGRDPGQWQTNVPTYGAVVYQEIYPGIDLTFYGNNRQLEYDFVVKPGADPRNVRLAYEGIEGLRVTETGDLEIALNGGVILQRKPVVYQMINGQRVDVAGAFTVQTPVQQGSRVFAYGFDVAWYDATQPLVIDPTLVYSTYLGGGDSDIGNSVAVDAAGNAYVAGKTQSVNFPTSGPLQAGLNGGSDVFVTKLNPAGTAAVYATYLGGSGADEAAGIAVDAAGNAYVTGRTSSSDFPTAGPLQATSGGGTDAFLVKLAPTGAGLVYATYLGGGGADFGMGVAVDSAGNAYVTGQTQSSDFPTAPTASALQPTLGSANGDGFVAKVNAAGAALVYSTYLGGSGADTGNGIAVDASGNAYVAGETQSADFPTTSALQPTFGGGTSDAFVTKLNPVGSLIVYSSYLGGSGSDAGHGIAVGSAASAYVVGATQSPNFPTVNAVQTTPGGLTDAFVARFGTAGAPLLYSTYLGGSNDDVGLGIAVDAASNAYATGHTASGDFPVVSPLQATSGGASDAFVARLNATGTAFGYSTYFGGNGIDEGHGIAVDAAGNAYLTGMTESSNLDMVNPMQGVFAGTQDAFAAKISPLNELTVVKAGNGNGTVTSSPSGITCGATCSAFFGPGALVSLTALPVPPAAFTGWSGACSGVSSCVVTMDASKSVTATFSIPEPTVTRVSPSPVIYGVTPSQSITIYGSSFVVGARITVGGLTGTTVAGFVASAATPFVQVSSGQLAFYWPNTTLPPGSYAVQVANPASVGGGSGSLADAFVVTAPQPTITNLTPATVLYGVTPSQSITIYGSNFAAGARITVGSLTGTTVAGSVASAATPFVYVTRTQLKFYWANTALPAAAYTVQVTNPASAGGLNGSLANGFT